MPFRKVVLPNGEALDTRIEPSALVEWLGDREGLKARGYPDRPPDVDTPKHRVWVSHPNETNDMAVRYKEQAEPGEVTPVFSVTRSLKGLGERAIFKAFIEAVDDGYQLRWAFEYPDRPGYGRREWRIDARVDDAEADRFMQATLEMVSEMPSDDDPMITGPHDFAELDGAAKAARDDIVAYFGPYPDRES